jgi:hypothetical protein
MKTVIRDFPFWRIALIQRWQLDCATPLSGNSLLQGFAWRSRQIWLKEFCAFVEKNWLA